MAILKRLDYVIKKTSANEIQNQITGVLTNLNQKQNNPSNKKAGLDLYEFYATLFDPRDNKEYLIFSDKAKASFELSESSILLTPDAVSSTLGNEELVNLIVAEIERKGLMGAKIDDVAPSAEKVYSSQKVTAMLEDISEQTRTEVEKISTKVNTLDVGVDMEFLLSL